MLAPANRSLIIPRQRRNADRVCAPPSPGLAVFAAYFRLIPTTSTARAIRETARPGEPGDVSPPETAARGRPSGDAGSDMAARPCGRGECVGVPRAACPPVGDLHGRTSPPWHPDEVGRTVSPRAARGQPDPRVTRPARR